MDIQNRVFVVSGGASGLGEATVRRLVGHGARVVIADFDIRRGEALAAELGSVVRYVPCDVCSDADANTVVWAALAAFDRIDGLVNCAGVPGTAKAIGREGPMPLSHFEHVLRINLIGTFNMIRVAVAAIQKQVPNDDGERGVVVNTASVAAFEGQVGQAAYSASKAGVVGMTLPLAREFACIGVRVVTIAPGPFMTPVRRGMSQEAQDAVGRQVPFPSRLGRSTEFASMVQCVIENPMLNGETIRLDGGIRMGPQ